MIYRKLESLGINTHCMKWQRYETSIYEYANPFEDQVLTEPPGGVQKTSLRSSVVDLMDGKEIDSFVVHITTVLLLGKYTIRVRNMLFSMRWYHYFKKHGFDMMKYLANYFKVHKEVE